MKVQQSTQLINPFGGIQFVLKHIKEQGIDTFMDEQLASRGAKKEYWLVLFQDETNNTIYTGTKSGNFIEICYAISWHSIVILIQHSWLF